MAEPQQGQAARRKRIAACPTPVYHETHRYCPSCPWTEKDDDPDYSPAFQDEYQRLWHEAAAERDALRERLLAAEQALREIADLSYIGNYDDATVIEIYRKWAKHALAGGDELRGET